MIMIAPVLKYLAASATLEEVRRRGGDASRTRVECPIVAIGFKSGGAEMDGTGRQSAFA
jgi:hypothetical protein